MYNIKKKLIKLILNKKKPYIYTKAQDTFLTKEAFGKTFLVYNGKKWLKKKIENSYFLNKPIGSFKSLNTRKVCIYRQKKKKKKNKKK